MTRNTPEAKSIGGGLPTAPDPGPRVGAAVKSAQRALQILDFFAEKQQEARAREIAEAVGMPQSSASMLLRSLSDLGYLDYDAGSRTYLPSPRVALLGSWLDGGPIRDGSLIRALEHLSERTANAIFIATRSGIFSQYIYVVPGRAALRFHIPLGSRRLLVWSATGFALLSSVPDDEIRAIVRRTNAEIEESCISANDTLAGVKEAREKGYYFSRGLVTPGAGALAMPLPSGIDRARRPLVVSMAGMLDDFARREEDYVAAMREAIGRYLGEVK